MRVMPPKGGPRSEGGLPVSQPCVFRAWLIFLDRIYKMKTNGSKSNENDSENSVHSIEKSDSDRINKMDKMSSEKSNGAGNSVDSVHSVQNPLPNSCKV